MSDINITAEIDNNIIEVALEIESAEINVAAEIQNVNAGAGTAVGVDIINQDEEVIAHVDDGGEYQVTQFDGVRDRAISGNVTTILDNILD